LFSPTRTALEQFDNQHDFERMAADILNSLGYKNVELIAPRGGSDSGKDITFTTDDGRNGLACVTLRKDIDAKFKEDFYKRRAGEFSIYILFCTAHLTASKKLKFRQYCLHTLQAEFVSKDIETLRSLLDTTMRPIKEKYLHISSDNAYISEKLNLSICLRQESPPNPYGQRDSDTTLLAFSIRNAGSVPSYISSTGLEVIIDGENRTVIYEISRRSFPTNQYLKEEEPLLPGQCHTYLVDARGLSAQLQAGGENIVLKEAYVEDEIGNKYSTVISSDLTTWLLGFPPGKKYPYSLF